MIGGGTLTGLSKLLIQEGEYNKIIELAEKGDITKYNLLVGDIYKANIYSSASKDLEEDVVAASFGKIIEKGLNFEGNTENIAISILTMICLHIGNLAFLCSKMHQAKSIIFLGNFTRKESLANKLLDYAVRFYDKTIDVAR